MPVDTHMNKGGKLTDLNDLLKDYYGFRGVFLFEQFCNLAAVGDSCDICTEDKVYYNAVIDRSFLNNINNLDGTKGIDDFFETTDNVNIFFEERLPDFSGGDGSENKGTISFKDVKAIYSMPEGNPGEDELKAVDMDEGTDIMGKSGRTVMDMLSDHYKCSTDEEKESTLRRFLAAM